MDDYEDLELKPGIVEITVQAGDIVHTQLRTVVDTRIGGKTPTQLLREESETLLNALPVMKLKEIEETFMPPTVNPDSVDDEDDPEDEEPLEGVDEKGKLVKISRHERRVRKHQQRLKKKLETDDEQT